MGGEILVSDKTSGHDIGICILYIFVVVFVFWYFNDNLFHFTCKEILQVENENIFKYNSFNAAVFTLLQTGTEIMLCS